MISSLFKIRVVSGLIYIAGMATLWDIWWHQAIGLGSSGFVDSFWLPPHILVYTSVIVAIAVVASAWRESRDRLWRNIFLALLTIPFSRLLDSAWHGAFGVEDPGSSFPIIFWSPPHLAIAAAFMVSAIAILPLIRREKNPVARQLFSGLMIGAILTDFIFVVTPLQPLGPYNNFASAYFGLWGIGIIAAVFIGGLLFAERWIPGPGKATVATVFFLVLMSVVGMGQAWGGGLILSTRQTTPGWIITFSYLGAAVFLDITRAWRGILQGAAAGAFFGAIFFFAAQLVYTNILPASFEVIAMEILVSAFGGALAGIFVVKKEKNYR